MEETNRKRIEFLESSVVSIAKENMMLRIEALKLLSEIAMLKSQLIFKSEALRIFIDE